MNITWNCKNNYHVYTTDYDPDHSHFDRISSDVMDVQRVMNEISRLESKLNRPYKFEDFDGKSLDRQTLRELKKEMGMPEDMPASSLKDLNIRDAVESAAATHGDNTDQRGFTKAAGLENN